MHDSSQGNAMTEIALALAMGFFSIMVLTMVSMGAGAGTAPPAASVILAPPAERENQAGLIEPRTGDLIVVYHEGHFFDRSLRSVDPSAINASGRVVLALDPALPMGEALTARSLVHAENLIVSTLNEQWIKTLKEMDHERQ